MNKKEIILLVSGVMIGFIALPGIGLAVLNRKMKVMVRVADAMKAERGLDYISFTNLTDNKLADSEVNEFYVLKDRELRGKKLTDKQFTRLSQIEYKLFGEFSGEVVS